MRNYQYIRKTQIGRIIYRVTNIITALNGIFYTKSFFSKILAVIAGLLGETTAETKVTLTKLRDSILLDGEGD